MNEVYYRKWRPLRLDEIVGQSAIVHTLKQAVKQDRIAHAYLFCGPRGTGKTSTARIFAKVVNCLNPQEGEPDNSCEICKASNEGRALDLIEIDGASNRRIDDIRNLRERIHYVPNESTYKVYIIDEVHMLTPEAFNALLKTLEEPPKHAILIFATTEPNKIPLTIISRCQRFDFRRIRPEIIVARLQKLCVDENVEVETEVLPIVSRLAEGSLRDAENLLEQLVVSYGSKVKEDDVRDLLGMAGDESALALTSSIILGNVTDGLTTINNIVEQGNDLRKFLRATMEYLREILLINSGVSRPANYDENVGIQLKVLSNATTTTKLIRDIKIFAEVSKYKDIISPLPLELALVQSVTETQTTLINNGPTDPIIENKIHSLENPSEQAIKSPAIQTNLNTVTKPSSNAKQTTSKSTTEQDPVDLQWKEITRALRQIGTKFKVGALLNGSRDRRIADGFLTVSFSHRSHVERMQQELDNPEVRKAVNEQISKILGGMYQIALSEFDTKNSPSGKNRDSAGHLIRAAQAMGAQIVEQKEDIPS